jgi:hypothetical protein
MSAESVFVTLKLFASTQHFTEWEWRMEKCTSVADHQRVITGDVFGSPESLLIRTYRLLLQTPGAESLAKEYETTYNLKRYPCTDCGRHFVLENYKDECPFCRDKRDREFEMQLDGYADRILELNQLRGDKW